MRSCLWNGLLGDREIEVGDNLFAWSQRTQAGPVRYTMQATEDGAWHEAGHLTREEGQRFSIIEFRVRRTSTGH